MFKLNVPQSLLAIILPKTGNSTVNFTKELSQRSLRRQGFPFIKYLSCTVFILCIISDTRTMSQLLQKYLQNSLFMRGKMRLLTDEINFTEQ